MTYPPVDAGKQDWRRWAQAVRRGIDWKEVGRAVVDVLSNIDELEIGAKVLSYLPMANEVDLSPLHQRRRDITWSVTRTPLRGGLTVHPLGSRMETHRYGFEQPVASSREVDMASIDVVLVPGLVFDSAMGRIGHGGGYYDRLLSSIGPNTITIGVGASGVFVERDIPSDTHSGPLYSVVTEDGFN
ncbi:MAG: 5-formyltetrahydrofolate cyclo-ligase, partial [Acidobacteria bacterium]|nr:5-formyltetrahydrofolate cyclo-ligase [Acidobacteriota bacterium]